MNLFARSLISFLAAFLVVLALLALFMLLGYQASTAQWKAVVTAEVEEIVRQVITSGDTGPAADLPGEVSVFIYDQEKRLIYSNRGAGRRRLAATGSPKPLYNGSTLAGFYATGSLDFHAGAANRAFLATMQQVLLFTLLFSFLAAGGSAWLFARSLARPARTIRLALEGLSAGNLETPVAESGPKELRSIARSANTLREALQNEHLLRGQWVQDVVHDLRTPVTALNSQFDAIIDGLLPPTVERITKLKAELERISRLIDAFVELMHLETPGMKLRIGPVDLPDFLKELKERFAALLAQKAMPWQITCPPGKFQADETLLFRAVSNVADNAVKYGTAGSPVAVTVRREAGALILCITNQGPVIGEQERTKIFERLYRADYARGADGSGLGLTIAKKIVRLHGGRLTVESSAETGTTFCFFLPQPTTARE